MTAPRWTPCAQDACPVRQVVMVCGSGYYYCAVPEHNTLAEACPACQAGYKHAPVTTASPWPKSSFDPAGMIIAKAKVGKTHFDALKAKVHEVFGTELTPLEDYPLMPEPTIDNVNPMPELYPYVTSMLTQPCPDDDGESEYEAREIAHMEEQEKRARKWRTLIRIVKVVEGEIGGLLVVVPGRDPHAEIFITGDELPPGLLGKLHDGARCHARVNLDANKVADLRFTDWEDK